MVKRKKKAKGAGRSPVAWQELSTAKRSFWRLKKQLAKAKKRYAKAKRTR